jgi:PadR family transcriptional regulator
MGTPYLALPIEIQWKMPDASVEVLRGTLDLLILKAVSWGPMHGYGVARWIEHATSDVLQIEEGSLYPALHRLEARGWIGAEWGTSTNNRRAKFYVLTTKGRSQLRVEAATWSRFAQAVFAALEAPPPQPA